MLWASHLPQSSHARAPARWLFPSAGARRPDGQLETSVRRDENVLRPVFAAKAAHRFGGTARNRWRRFQEGWAESFPGSAESVAGVVGPRAASASWSIDDLSVAHVDDAITNAGGFWIVRDHQHRLPQFLIRLPQHAQHDV